MATSITPTGTELQISESSSFSALINEDNGTYRTSQMFEQDELPFGVTLYARVRHNSAETGWSAWSKTISFHVEVPAIIIGLAIDTSAAGGNLTYIDMQGNQISDPDMTTHAAFKNITMVTEDSSRAAVTMTKYPRFYIKTAASGPAGSFAEGKLCYWISDMPFEGFRVHPAFKRKTTRGSDGKYETNDFVYLGTYMGHAESVTSSGTCLGSKKGQTVATGSSSYTRSNLITYCKNRNNTSYGQSGWRCADIWDESLKRWSAVFFKKTFNTQSTYGTNTSSSPKTGATSSRIVYKGTTSSPEVWLDDVQSCYWQHLDGITISSGRVTLKSPMDGTTTLSIGGSTSDYTMATSSGWIKSFCSASVVIGDDSHDLLELFLPKTVTSSESSALVPDYYNYSTASSYMQVGGYWSNSSQGGIFSVHALADSYQESYQSYEVIRYDPVYEDVLVGYEDVIVGYEQKTQATWSSSRRCGYVFLSTISINGFTTKYTGTTSGNYTSVQVSGQSDLCTCPNKSTFRNSNFYGVCVGPDMYQFCLDDHLRDNTCPKGWGDGVYNGTSSSYVQHGQGCVITKVNDTSRPIYESRPVYEQQQTGTKPVYGYVTRYRTVYYNYRAARVAKS